MQEQVKRIVAGRSVLCAVSGGVDSVVLLHLLKNSGVRVIAAHMEHGIRGESSRRDCAFVEALCARWQIPLTVCHADVPREAAASGKGIEETARRLRYEFLQKQKEALQLDVIATAHHLNDQAETVLMHLIRGTSPAGLSGMQVEHDGLIRPLLNVPRSRIEAYALENGLEWVQDETNEDVNYTRNYIRHELLPRMERLNPRTTEALGRLAALAGEQNAYILQEAEKALAERMCGDALGNVTELHPGLRGSVVHAYLARCGATDITHNDVERLTALYAMPVGHRASIGAKLFERDAQGVHPVHETEIGEWLLQQGVNDTPLGRFTLEICRIPENLDCGRYAQVLDADKLDGLLSVRTRRDGDRVRLLGSAGSRLLSDVLTDRKIPRSQRDAVPLIACGGRIVWIAGIAPCADCAIDAHSRRAMMIRYEKDMQKQIKE